MSASQISGMSRAWCLLIAMICLALSTGCGEPKASRTPRPPEMTGYVAPMVSQSPPSSRDKVADVFEEPKGAAVYFFEACATEVAGNQLNRGFAAMLVALQDGGWRIDKMDRDSTTIEATACLRDNPAACARVVFRVEESGRIEAAASPTHPVSSELEDDVGRWLLILDKKYSVCRCYTDEYLRQEMDKFGFQY